MSRLIFCCLLIVLTIPGFSQAPPGTDIFLVSLSVEKDRLTCGESENITKRKGYDNQPFFTADGKSIFFTVIPDSGQADIFRYDIATKKTIQVTNTEESEFSPTPIANDKYFSTVRVEMDNAQRLWRFKIDGSSPELILENVKPVGYHTWGNEHTLALFVLGGENETHKLFLADTKSGQADSITNNIGRALQKIPGKNAISFTTQITDSTWQINALDLESRKITALQQAPPNSQDYTWTPSGKMIMPYQNKLYICHPGKEEKWQIMHEFSDPAMADLYRIAISPDMKWLALVGRGLEN